MNPRNRTLLLLTALAALITAAGAASAKDQVKIKEKAYVVTGEDGDRDVRVIVMDGDDDMPFHGRRMAFLGDVSGAYLGIHMQDLGEQLAAYFDAQGVLVESVVEDSPAAAAGLQAGDVITRLDDTEIDDAGDVTAFMSEREPGDEIHVKVKRKGKDKTIDVTLAEREMGGDVQALLDDGAFPHARVMRDFRAAPRVQREWHTRRFDDREAREELENLKADVAELKAMLEELRAKQ
ncbi:MAG TPA: PDZ domain-containing protein [Candidatus Krumholzibacteria bacterium]|nr:PDZ domain-containing protein [Candidatus Krumholzibacteria bacterium]HRX51359.1 PDZ domain-containing protein [Candidatus Krumholzibacteria bacterium]